MHDIQIPTDNGFFTAHLLGARGNWVVCWPSQLTDFEAVLDFANILALHHRVVICDPPAMGANQKLPYTRGINELVYFAHRVLTKLGIEHCDWVGHSAGGVVGAALHAAMPGRISTLTLASCPMLSQSRLKMHAAATTGLLSNSRIGRRILVARATQELGYQDESEKQLVTQYLGKVFERTLPKTIAAMRPLDGTVVRRTFDRLRIDHPPMLVLTGIYDGIVLPRDQRTVAEITRSQFVELTCGHMSLLAEPEVCAHAFERFVSQPDAQITRPTQLMESA